MDFSTEHLLDIQHTLEARLKHAKNERDRHHELQKALSALFRSVVPSNFQNCWDATEGLDAVPQHAKMGFVVKYAQQLTRHIYKTARMSKRRIVERRDSKGNRLLHFLLKRKQGIIYVPIKPKLSNFLANNCRSEEVGAVVDEEEERKEATAASTDGNAQPNENLAGDNREAEDRDGQILTVPELFAKLYLTPPPSKHQTKNNLSKPAKDNVVKVVKKKVRGRKLDTERMDKAKKCLFRETKVPFVSKNQYRIMYNTDVTNGLPTTTPHGESLDDDLAGIEPMSDLEDSICMLLGNAGITNLSSSFQFDRPELDLDLELDLAMCDLPPPRDPQYLGCSLLNNFDDTFQF